MKSAERPPFVSVVVPVRNGEATLADCLASLTRLDYPEERREIVVVDNASSDGTARILGEQPVRVVREPRPGLPFARNRGIEASRGELVAFTDADCFVTTRWLSELVEGLSDGAFSAAVGEVVAFPPCSAAERYVATRKPLWQKWTCEKARPWFLFGNAAVRRAALEGVGRFDTRFRGGCEDIDYAWRFFEAGLTACYRPRAVSLHRHRLTPRDLLRQHVGYGRGQFTLHRKYAAELPWGWRREAAAWADLGSSTAGLPGAWVRGGAGEGGARGFEYQCFDLVRKVGQRAGFVREAVATRFADGRSAGDAHPAESRGGARGD